MPTGYTAAIGENPDMTLREFVLDCARAFGACLHQRDDPMGGRPKHRKPSSYHADSLKQAEDELRRIETLTEEQLSAEASEKHNEALQQYREWTAKDEELQRRYERMRSMVADWKPPTEDHNELKKFMLEQIDQSIKSDCGYGRTIPQLLSVEEYRAQLYKRVRWDIEYSRKRDAEEKRNCAQANAWIDAVYESVGGNGTA